MLKLLSLHFYTHYAKLIYDKKIPPNWNHFNFKFRLFYDEDLSQLSLFVNLL